MIFSICMLHLRFSVKYFSYFFALDAHDEPKTLIKLWWGLYDWLCTVIKNNNMLVDGGKNKECTAIEKLRFLIDNVLFVNKKPGPARRVSGCGPAAVDHLGKQQSWTSPDCCSPPPTHCRK